nr:MAG: hypothetical protein DIU78_23525 [Pseudomonadota bacterium]
METRRNTRGTWARRVSEEPSGATPREVHRGKHRSRARRAQRRVRTSLGRPFEGLGAVAADA